jgi:hypothetical protein
MGLGLVMLVLGAATVMVAQGDRATALQRKESGSSLAVTEGGIARLLAQLAAPNNSILLGRNYDTINPDTGKTYLGRDGILNSGDEQNTAVDEWTTYDTSSFPCFQQQSIGTPTLTTTGSMGAGTYVIRAYRYNARQGIGTLVVEGIQGQHRSAVSITVQIEPDLNNFPGVLTQEPYRSSTVQAGALALRGREILGSNGNVYYLPAGSADPDLNGISNPDDPSPGRSEYLNALWSSPAQDGASTNNVSGRIFACQLSTSMPLPPAGTNVGVIDTSQTLVGNNRFAPTVYRVEQIDLNNEILNIDTTNGPVYLQLLPDGSPSRSSITLRGTAQIQNIRTDGQPPKVGDLRILSWDHTAVRLFDRSCIQDAFLWLWRDELRLLTSGPGCPSGKNTNVEGVVWVESVLSSQNNASNRDIVYVGRYGEDYDTMVTPGATAGIAVPDDLASLKDVLKHINWPVRYRFRGIQNWQRFRL